MYYCKEDDIVYAICERDIQNEAEYALGRKLTEDELEIALKGLNYGIGTSIGIIYHTIFTEMIPESMG
jgi:hypothetical protein